MAFKIWLMAREVGAFGQVAADVPVDALCQAAWWHRVILVAPGLQVGLHGSGEDGGRTLLRRYDYTCRRAATITKRPVTKAASAYEAFAAGLPPVAW